MPESITKYVGNDDGIVEFLKDDSGLQRLISGMTRAVANTVQEAHPKANADNGTERVDVEVNSFVGQTWHPKGDRFAGMVTLAHPAGIAIEAKHGYLKRAAEGAGFEWGRRGDFGM